MQMIKRVRLLLIFIVLIIFTSTIFSQPLPDEIIRSVNPRPASPEQMKWFSDARYGLFIHWGPGCLSGKDLSWSRRGPRPGDQTGHYEEEKTVPQDVYDNYYKLFNPTKFDARQWVKMAQDAGMNYIVFTSKHHDGFSNFHTKFSDYNIANTPFKRDIVKELADACHQAGMRFGIYYSVRDWYHPDYLKGDNSKYREFYTGQLNELLTNYGKIDLLWFDSTFGADVLWDFQGVLKMIFRLQPDILINDRYSNSWKGDYFTPEQQTGAFDRDRAWESCGCLVDGQWAYRPNGILLTTRETLGMLLGAVGGDGNLLLNVGPPPNGKIEDRQADRLREVGSWLREYGKGIYGSRGGPYKPGYWGYSTFKANHIYLYLNQWDTPELILPSMDKKILSYKLLSGGNINLEQNEHEISITIPPSDRKDLFTVVELTIDGNALDIKPIKSTVSGSLAFGKKVEAGSNGMPRLWWHNPCDASNVLDDNINTRWRANEGSSEAWLQIDLGELLTFDRAMIEDDGNVEDYEIQILSGEKWKTIYKGKSIGKMHRIQFNPVTAKLVRLNILSTKDTPDIWEFHLFKQQ